MDINSMDKFNLVIDISLCENCNNCVLATKDELVGNNFPGYSVEHEKQGRGVMWIERIVRGSGHHIDCSYRPSMCVHCDDAPCVAASKGAVVKRSDGVVLIDPEKSKGRKDLVSTCPYGAIVWNETRQVPQNWFFDVHLLDDGLSVPRVESVCPTKAIETLKCSDSHMAERVISENLQTWLPELKTKPRVYYKNFHRFNTVFIAGSIATESGGDCISHAEICLEFQGDAIQMTRSDEFGDFKFDCLMPMSGPYKVIVKVRNLSKEIDIQKVDEEAINLGVINI
jgi:Fe-S-cluster-containing dehydrogenase component